MSSARKRQKPIIERVLAISDFIAGFMRLPVPKALAPWDITSSARELVSDIALNLDRNKWIREGDIVRHHTATISSHAFVDGPAVIGPQCRISHGAYLREGVWLDECVTVGSHCEIKSSFVFAGSRIAHLNYIGNSLVGEDVNIEAGVVIANHWNERNGEDIVLRLANGDHLTTDTNKFGAIIGDRARLGANAVTSPGTLLPKGTVVGRLELIDQRVR